MSLSTHRITIVLLMCALTGVPSALLAQTTGNTTLPCVSLLWEAESYTPPFYRGRPLASAGTPIHIYADAQFYTSNGGRIGVDDITYTWSINGRVTQNLSGIGKRSLTLGGPALFGALIVSVEATSPDGKLRAGETVRINAEEPILALYEHDSLAGTMYRSAYGKSDTLVDAQTTLAAEPYFFLKPVSLADIIYTWRVDNTPARSDTGRPNMLTVSAPESDRSTVSLSVTNARQSLQTAKRTWQFIFTTSIKTSNFLNLPQ